MTRRLLVLLLWMTVRTPVSGQQDSVVITGQVINLTGRLYREASFITFSRNNILHAGSEFSRNAPLQADGTFRVALPLVYPSEEIYLDYGGKVYTTFLAGKGEVKVTFDADSMFKSRKLFRFAGVNASANNLYPEYLAEEARLMEGSKQLGADFFRSFWSQGLPAARQSLLQRSSLRLSALSNLAARGQQSRELTEWVTAVVEDEQSMLLMEYALSNQSDLSPNDNIGLLRLGNAPLTYQKVMLANRLREYADRQVDSKLFSGSRSSGALPVETLARLLRDHVKPLERDERDKLGLIAEKKNADKTELSFMSNLLKRGGDQLNPMISFERLIQGFNELYDGLARDFLIASLYTENLYRYPLDDQFLLHGYLQEILHNRVIRQSLSEVFQLEVKEAAAMRTAFTLPVSRQPTEIFPRIYVAESSANGKEWLDNVQKLYEGKTLYVVNWDLYNEKSREELEGIRMLRQQLPDDVVFLYLHIPDPERVQTSESGQAEKERRLWKQYMIRHGLEGTHLLLNPLQIMQLGLRYPGIPGVYFIIKPNGRYHSRNAPSPLKPEEAVTEILNARNK